MLDKYINFFLWLLFGEAIFLLVLIFFIILHRIHKIISNRSLKKRKEKIETFIFSQLEQEKPFIKEQYPGNVRWDKALLQVLENISSKITGEAWEQLSHNCAEAFLLPQARKFAKKRSWIKRNLAARSFALCPKEVDEPILLNLVEDNNSLIRTPAALALVALESRVGIRKILWAIRDEPGYTEFIFRDILLRGSNKVVKYLIEFAEDPILHPIVLDFLGAKSWGKELPFLEKDLNSPDPKIFELALKVLIQNPLPLSYSFFLRAVKHFNPNIRILGMQGLGQFILDGSWKILHRGLRDPDWTVRVEAGKVLKSQGELGIALLKRQKEKRAQETAQFVMEFE
jgi:hypothetical protein